MTTPTPLAPAGPVVLLARDRGRRSWRADHPADRDGARASAALAAAVSSRSPSVAAVVICAHRPADGWPGAAAWPPASLARGRRRRGVSLVAGRTSATPGRARPRSDVVFLVFLAPLVLVPRGRSSATTSEREDRREIAIDVVADRGVARGRSVYLVLRPDGRRRGRRRCRRRCSRSLAASRSSRTRPSRCGCPRPRTSLQFVVVRRVALADLAVRLRVGAAAVHGAARVGRAAVRARRRSRSPRS